MPSNAKKSDYTEAEIAEIWRRYHRDGTLPEGSVFDPTAAARGEPVWRKATRDEAAQGTAPTGGTAAPEEPV